jgi:trans-aconitate 2-methyltransferase
VWQRPVTAVLERLPRGRVVAVDSSEAMAEHARRALGDRATVFRADLTELSLDEPVDAVFSNAVFHWIPDHDRLFERLFAALRPGGRVVAQCGGEGNVAGLIQALRRVYRREEFADAERPPRGYVNFAAPEQTRARLEAAGVTDVQTWLEPKNVVASREFLRTVSLGANLKLLPAARHEEFIDAVIEELGEPIELDYVRLNIDARRPA